MNHKFFLLILFATVVMAQSTPKLTVSWIAPTQNTDGSAIPAGSLTYQMYQGGDGKYAALGSPTAATSYAVTSGLTAGIQACFYVVAIEAGQESGASAEACATPAKPAVIPKPPTNVTAK